MSTPLEQVDKVTQVPCEQSSASGSAEMKPTAHKYDHEVENGGQKGEHTVPSAGLHKAIRRRCERLQHKMVGEVQTHRI